MPTSSLTTSVAGQNATVFSQAVGGPSYSGGHGGAASSTTDITSSADQTSLFSRALAGLGGTAHGAVDAAGAPGYLAPPGSGFRSGGVGGEAVGGDCGLGSPGCRGGDATSTSTGNAAGSSTVLEVSDSATGGNGGFGDEGTTTRQDGGAGGNATSSASAVSEFLAFADSSATGGTGGEGLGADSIGGAGGTASANAFASGGINAGASVTVTGGAGSEGVGASGRGGDVALENVPVAEAPNQINLTQNAYGGSSGSAASRGGDARSVLTNTGYQGFALRLNASAIGGTAQALDGAAPARAGDASVVVDGIVSGQRDVFVAGDSIAGSLIGPNGRARHRNARGPRGVGLGHRQRDGHRHRRERSSRRLARPHRRGFRRHVRLFCS